MSETIGVIGRDRTLRFAARELARYLRKLTGRTCDVARVDGVDLRRCRLVLALPDDLPDDLPLDRPRGLGDGDDWIRIIPQRSGQRFILTGANPRSVLFAAYRYLQAAGVRWIRPGRRGEIVPKRRSAAVRDLDVNDRPAYRYRTICIEGSTSPQHILDLIDWMAKQGMNGYFIQFHYGTIFFRRWFEHRGNEYMKPEPADEATIAKHVDRIIKAINARGMRFERMGHGWTCAAMGISGEGGWDVEPEDAVPEDRREWIAKINGERKFFGGISLNTNLDYSRQDVRDAVTDSIVEYAKGHPSVDLLHFWLADGTNNHDEGAAYRKQRPSDWYVTMLNELDEKLEAAGLATRIVFLIYVDLLWPPTKQTIRNPDRFTLMFAPITRSYLRSFTDVKPDAKAMAPFKLNHMEMPKDVAANLAYLQAWRDQFPGDGFDFDYHAIWACYYDPNMITIARTLHKDLQGLRRIGLDGLNSCQNQRMSFPHNLLLDVMARTLWNPKTSFRQIAESTFADAYGEDWGEALGFFEKASRLWEPFFEAVYIPERDGPRIDQGLKNIPKLERLIESIRPIVAKNAKARGEQAIRWSWKYLDSHIEFLDLLIPAMRAYLDGNPQTRALLREATDFLWRNEKTLHPALDVFMLCRVLDWRANELEAWLGQARARAAS